MTEEKTMKNTQETEPKAEQPKRRPRRRSGKNTSTGETRPAEEAAASELTPAPKQQRSRKKTLDEAIAAVIGATAVAEEPVPAEEKPKGKGRSRGKKEETRAKDSGKEKPARQRRSSKSQRFSGRVTAEESTIIRAEPLPEKQERASRRKKENIDPNARVRIIPLGGLLEIGKNMTVYECDGDMFIVDCGMTFPDDEMFGVDTVIPDFTFVERNRDKFKGIVITHGHEDHIGGLAYLLKTVNMPVYATRLTLALIEHKLKEHGLLGRVKLQEVVPGSHVKLGCFDVEFIAVNHSIPDACALAITTKAGLIVQTGDFKVDYTPVAGPVIDLARFGELGRQGVLALLSDSTNAERPGATKSERVVGGTFETLFKQAERKRIIIATFSSNVHRLQQIVNSCVKHGRKLAVSGRSMVNMVERAVELGYLKAPEGTIIDVDLIGRYPDDKLVIATTGSQGEPMSALTRMAMNDHRKISVTPNDCIILSASPIPGNEESVTRVVNALMRQGADVIYEKTYDLHTSGHAQQDELKLMLALTKPKFFMPVHGEYKHLKKHSNLAESMGVQPENIIIGENGRIVELSPNKIALGGTVPVGAVMVDGLGVGDVGSIVLRDRKHLAQDGLIIVVVAMDGTGHAVSGPDIVSRGFVYVREAEDMMSDARRVCLRALDSCSKQGIQDWSSIKNAIKDQLGQFIYGRTKRSPMILPIIQEI